MIKQVIIMRNDLNMRKGKMIAQGAHASQKVFFDRMKLQTLAFDMGEEWKNEFTSQMIEWKNTSFTKIVVGCNSEEELHNIKKQADKFGIVNAIILDNGNTEFKEECPECKGTGFCVDPFYDDNHPNPCLSQWKCIECQGTGKVNKPTYTCLAIGPDEAGKIDKITGNLRLL